MNPIWMILRFFAQFKIGFLHYGNVEDVDEASGTYTVRFAANDIVAGVNDASSHFSHGDKIYA